MRRIITVLLFVLVFSFSTGCSPAIKTQKVSIIPIDTKGNSIQIEKSVEITFDTGFSRILRRGSQWKCVGRISQGKIFKPLDQVLTIEGKHVAEAYLVLSGHELVGFYLPVQKAYSPHHDKVALPIKDLGVAQ